MKDFLKKNRPEAPEANPREASIIWAKISILNINKKPKFLLEKGILIGFLAMLLLGIFSLPNFDSPDPQIMTDLQNSMDIDYDSEEISEVNDLISLVQ